MNELIKRLFDAGAHYGYSKASRNPAAESYIYGTKEGMEITDLEKTAESLKNAQEFVAKMAADKKQLLFISSKPEARALIQEAAEAIDQPYIAGRWIGGTFTNIEQMKKRIKKLVDLKTKRDRGELAKYTKKEQLLISREIEDLESRFGGIADMRGLPGAIFVIDPKAESIAVHEATKRSIPIIALMNTDNSDKKIDYPIYGNDSNRSSIRLFINEIAKAYNEAVKKN